MGMPVSLVALKKLRYANQSYSAGEVFEARDAADATVLKLTKLAADAPTRQSNSPAPVALEEPSSAEPDTESEPTHRRRYRRRDMEPEP